MVVDQAVHRLQKHAKFLSLLAHARLDWGLLLDANGVSAAIKALVPLIVGRERMTCVRGKEKEVDVDGGEVGNDWCLRARAVAIRDQQQWLAVANELAQSLAVPYNDLGCDVSILRSSKCHVRVFARDVVIDGEVVILLGTIKYGTPMWLAMLKQSTTVSM